MPPSAPKPARVLAVTIRADARATRIALRSHPARALRRIRRCPSSRRPLARRSPRRLHRCFLDKDQAPGSGAVRQDPTQRMSPPQVQRFGDRQRAHLRRLDWTLRAAAGAIGHAHPLHPHRATTARRPVGGSSAASRPRAAQATPARVARRYQLRVHRARSGLTRAREWRPSPPYRGSCRRTFLCEFDLWLRRWNAYPASNRRNDLVRLTRPREMAPPRCIGQNTVDLPALNRARRELAE